MPGLAGAGQGLLALRLAAPGCTRAQEDLLPGLVTDGPSSLKVNTVLYIDARLTTVFCLHLRRTDSCPRTC